ncbi:hypothetical protein COR50_15430 [Chitinophaga caeni]|uniref:Uncharacterized protein n=1 Tax=Chitinophaga caeni TaxID=2029983 RepID=A0A291QWZ6_9BACT|nr:hypothetical protein [Chitinophaga caeni]ATL48441.1 hypothetical protein COR50_15430 [Chitinophaga caeni]
MEQHLYTLKIPENYTYEKVMEERATGGRFVFFVYNFSLPLFRSIRRISSIHYIPPGKTGKEFNFKYNLHNLIFGWWGLPFGPAEMIDSIKSNKAGIDISNDIYDNLDEQSFNNRSIEIIKISDVFKHPSKDINNELMKALKNYQKKESKFHANPWVGLYVNTEHPFYIIGFDPKDIQQQEIIKKYIYKRFYKNIEFLFIDLDSDFDAIESEAGLSAKLKQQGLELALL